MRHITLTCPECMEPDKAVGDPNEGNSGHSGGWYCFACHAKGDYTVEFEVWHEAVEPV